MSVRIIIAIIIFYALSKKAHTYKKIKSSIIEDETLVQ